MGKSWENDTKLFALAKRELFTAVVGDVMDKLGFQKQFLPPQIQPLAVDMVTIGRAMTVLEADCYQESSSKPSSGTSPETTSDQKNPVMSKPFGLMFEALDDLKPNEIYICTGASPTYALWGELMTVRAKILEAAGAVVNGYARDTNEILTLDFPVFAYGSYAQDQGPRGKVIDYRVPIEIEGVRIQPGDIVFCDRDGVCIVPQAAEVEIFMAALEKARGEKTVKEAIENGMSASEAFATYGIM